MLAVISLVRKKVCDFDAIIGPTSPTAPTPERAEHCVYAATREADGQKHLVSLQPLTYDADVAQMSSASLPDRGHVSPRWSAGTERSRRPWQTMVSSLSALSYPGKLGVLIVAG